MKHYSLSDKPPMRLHWATVYAILPIRAVYLVLGVVTIALLPSRYFAKNLLDAVVYVSFIMLSIVAILGLRSFSSYGYRALLVLLWGGALYELIFLIFLAASARVYWDMLFIGIESYREIEAAISALFLHILFALPITLYYRKRRTLFGVSVSEEHTSEELPQSTDGERR